MIRRTHRIGPRMAHVRQLASQPGGIAVIDAARLVGPHGSLMYGYQTVRRAVAAGIVAYGRPDGTHRRGRFLTAL